MFELGVAIRVRRTFAGLLQRVQPIAEPMQELPDRRRTDQPPLRGERPREARRALAGPPQWRHRVAPCQRFDQEVQRLGHPGLGLLNIRTPGPGTANPVRRRHALRQLQTPIADRLPGQPRRGRDHRVPAEADRHRFRRRPQSPRALIEQWGHRHVLGHERGFEVCVALHRTWVRSRYPCMWQANSRARP